MRAMTAQSIIATMALLISASAGPAPVRPVEAAPAFSEEVDQVPVAGGADDGPPVPSAPSVPSPGVGIRAVFDVNSTADTVDAAPGNGACQDAGGACTLRAAIMEANQLGGSYTVNLPGGTYVLTRAGSDDAGATDDLDIRVIVSIVGSGVGATFVDGGGQFRVFDVRPGAAATISNLTIRNGSVTNGQGAGLRNQGIATLQTVHIVDNRATSGATVQGNGAGLANSSGGITTITDGVVSGNQSVAAGSVGAFGGGIANFGVNNSPNAVTSVVALTNTVVTNNRADSNGGGLTLNQQGARLTLQNSTVAGNTATNGGGGIAMGGSGASALLIEGTTISGNTASTSLGGGILGFLASTGTSSVAIAVDRSTIDGNVAGTSSGGIAFGGPNSVLSIANSALTNNQANGGNGGALALGSTAPGTSPGQASITNTTISGNRSGGGGGGIASSLLLSMTNISVVNNTANVRGGGLSIRPNTASVKNSIVAKNAAPLNTNCDGSMISQGGNLESAATCTFTNPSDRLNTSPLLGPLANNGGPTLTHLPLAGSPAIDGGMNADCPLTDQRGTPRPIDGNGDGSAICDVGAVEAPRSDGNVVNCSPRPKVDVAVVPTGDGRLRVTLSVNGAGNTIQQVQVTRNVNGILNPGAPATGGTQSVFFVSRSAAGQPTTVSLAVTDACGVWPTFVGGGASAF